MSSVSVADFLELKNEFLAFKQETELAISLYPDWIDVKSLASKYRQKHTTVKAYINRNSSELGIGTLFKDSEIKVSQGTMYLHKSAVLKLQGKYHA